MVDELGGPYLAAAVFCEKVIEDKQGILSLIGIIDRITQSAVGPDAPEKMPPLSYNLHLVLSFKSGFARGTQSVRLRALPPEGPPMGESIFTVFFEGEDRGNNLILQMALALPMEGLYWFDILLGERLVTRMPLRVVYQRLSLGPRPGPGS